MFLIVQRCAVPILALFDTTSRAMAATDGPRWRASRESHPSEDLSELPPKLDFIMGRSIITRLLMRVGLGKPSRNAKQPATGCFGDGWEPLSTLFGRL